MINQLLIDSVLLPVHPKWCELIASREKTVEVRTTVPNIPAPFKCYIYQTKKPWIYKLLEKLSLYRGKVIGEFICDKIDTYEMEGYNKFDNVYQAINRIEVDEMTYDTYQYTEVSNDMSDVEISKSRLLTDSCLTFDEIGEYVCGNKEFGFHTFYGWHISNLVIYDEPKELSDFKQCHKCEYKESCIESECSCDGTHNLRTAPQSWCYVKKV